MDQRSNRLSPVMNPADISIQDYSYELPVDRIALHPLVQRDDSRLLLYKDGEIKETKFAHIVDFLPEGSLMVFNNTKVINARVKFKKTTGAVIEIFCLEPQGTITEYSSVMSTTGSVQWKCLVGGAAKWKDETLEKNISIDHQEVLLRAEMVEKVSDAYSIKLSWLPASFSFASVIEAAGDVPLPPYIKRNTDEEDHSRYQTIFAEQEGSVAAPTAGLHFTPEIFDRLPAKNIKKVFVTLHVGAGTFKPVKAASMAEHEMHAEYIDVERCLIKELIQNLGNITAVGTTSLRTIESLYWLGVKAHLNPLVTALQLGQWDIYREPLASSGIGAQLALEALLHWMEKNQQSNLFTQTQLLIAPGYLFRITNQLVTNFHQPESTLLLLVAAAIGEKWKIMYEYALAHGFRFLSYGDGNLLFITNTTSVRSV
jgi:S-adenosylmethionine:tRNA ribosyltransferase-isomerase